MQLIDAGEFYADYINRKPNYRKDAVSLLSDILHATEFWVVLSKDIDTDYTFITADISPIDISKYALSNNDAIYIPDTTQYIQLHERVHTITDKDATKESLWNDNYELNDEPAELAYWKQMCKDSIPDYSLSQSGSEKYVSFVKDLKTEVNQITNIESIPNINYWMQNNGYLQKNPLNPKSFIPTAKLENTGIDCLNIPTNKEDLRFQAGLRHFKNIELEPEIKKMILNCAKICPNLFAKDILTNPNADLTMHLQTRKQKLDPHNIDESTNKISKNIFKQSQHM